MRRHLLLAVGITVVFASLDISFGQTHSPPGSMSTPPSEGATGVSSSGVGVTEGKLEINENNFLLLDRNQNGVIEFDEDFRGAPMLREQFLPQLQPLDSDGDGRVTREEFFGAAEGGSWRPAIAALLGIAAFAGVCLAVDGVLDKTRRVLVLPGLGIAAVSVGLAWLVHAGLLVHLLPALVPSVLILIGTLGIAVALGKPVEETEVEFLPTLQGGPGKRYVIGKGGRLLGVKSGEQKQTRPVRRPRRPPG